MRFWNDKRKEWVFKAMGFGAITAIAAAGQALSTGQPVLDWSMVVITVFGVFLGAVAAYAKQTQGEFKTAANGRRTNEKKFLAKFI